MHKYLRAIGFSEIKKEELEKLWEQIEERPDDLRAAEDSEGNEFAELRKSFGAGFGISLRGIFREDDSFEREYYYPYFFGKTISTREPAEVEKHAEKESYAGICDEVRIGVTLIFYLQNITDYLSVRKTRGHLNLEQGVVLGGLSAEGKILFPVYKADRGRRHTESQMTERSCLIAAARDGDEDAIESLTLEDMDTYSLISKRITHEDVLSIVDSYFMPHGIESDQYAVLGEILDYSLVQNEWTGEQVYVLELLCNDMVFGLCINRRDLLGEPAVGRRFKGIVWMQGSIKYRD